MDDKIDPDLFIREIQLMKQSRLKIKTDLQYLASQPSLTTTTEKMILPYCTVQDHYLTT